MTQPTLGQPASDPALVGKPLAGTLASPFQPLRFSPVVFEPIVVRYRLTVSEMLEAQRWYFRRQVRPLPRRLLYACVPLLAAAGLLEWRAGGSSLSVWAPLGAAAYIALNFVVIRPWVTRRRYAKRPDRDLEVEWRVGDERIQVVSPHARSDFAWQALYEVVQTPRGFLLFTTPQIFHWLPRGAFTGGEEFDRVLQLARERGIKARQLAA